MLHKVFAGENRRAAIMGVVGAPAILALLVFRLFTGGESAALPPLPAGPVLPAAAVPAAAASVPAPLPPIDPALLRDPFCPLAAAVPGSAPAECRPPTVLPGLQSVRLEDIFVEGDVRLARMRVGQIGFSNLHEGDAVAGSFRVISLSDRCGEFEVAGAPFSLCEGEETVR